MKKNLLVELNAFIDGVRIWDFLDSDKVKRGVQLIMDAAQELVVLRSSHTKLHRRAVAAESALPEWKEICRATEHQATGRFFPALVRLALTKSEEENTALKLKIEKQTEEMRDMNDRYFKSFELAGGKPDDNADDLPRLIEALVQSRRRIALRLARGIKTLVLFRKELVRATSFHCSCGAVTGYREPHRPDCVVELLTTDTPANRELTDVALEIGLETPGEHQDRRSREFGEPTFDEVLSLAQEIASPIGSIPGTANLGPGLSPRLPVFGHPFPVQKLVPTLPLHYELMPESSPPNARIFDATGTLILRIEVVSMRGRAIEDDLRTAALQRIKQLNRSIEEVVRQRSFASK